MKNGITIKENSIVPVVVTMAILSSLGGLIALSIAFVISAGAVMMSGPLGWLFLGPAVIAGFSSAITWVVIGVPLVACIGGWIISFDDVGRLGRGATAMRVDFFHDEHNIYKRVQELASELDLPTIPHVGWFPDESINAFAMGIERNNALIAFSQGAIEKLSKEQFDAVIGHELAHVANGDMRNMTYARRTQEALTFFLVFRGLKKFVRWLFLPLSELKVLHHSRQREFAADKIGAQLTSPDAMVSALQAIGMETKVKTTKSDYDNLKIASALSGSIWRTHPDLSKRIEAIENTPFMIERANGVESTEPIIKQDEVLEIIQKENNQLINGFMSFGI